MGDRATLLFCNPTLFTLAFVLAGNGESVAPPTCGDKRGNKGASVLGDIDLDLDTIEARESFVDARGDLETAQKLVSSFMYKNR